jgi:hypothetical protein
MIEKDEKLVSSLVPIHFRLVINIFLSPQAKYTQVRRKKNREI